MRSGSLLLCCSVLAVAPLRAQAGEKVLEGAVPSWVVEADIAQLDMDDGPAQLINDSQYRMEDGEVRSYHDNAVRIDNSQTLMAQNTLSIDWLPDKGDLTVHRLQILRDGEVIDLLAKGVEFDVIRREQGLESRLLDGQLTATLSIPGLRVGDVLRTTYSISTHDQAMGDEMQVLQYLGSKPWRVGMGRVIVSWPEDEQMFWKAEEIADLGEPETRGGYRYLTVKLPLEEAEDMPQDAPSRYRRPTVLRVGSFTGWRDLSRVMAPHFLSAAEVAPDGPVAKQAAAIERQTSDPLERAVLATRLVQDKISYLLNGLDGGNYLPQKAEFTWEKRYGDCKAKSVLLLALLRQMGIAAEPTLVASEGGDALPYLLPIPGDFDHVIVRATIDGTDYWLDGTSTATRLATINAVPPFYYALPLRKGGADITPMVQREKTYPDFAMSGTVDHSAGVDFPQLFKFEMRMSGPAAAAAEALADAKNPEMLRRMASSFARSSGIKGGVLSSLTVSYDKEEAIGRLAIEGVAGPQFDWEDGKLAVDDDFAPATNAFNFNPNRAKRAWRDVPVATPGPSYAKVDVTLVLPDDGRGFALEGPAILEGSFANTRVSVSESIKGDTVHTKSEVWQTPGEVAPTDVAEAKLDAQRLEARTASLVPPKTATWRWDLDEKARRAKAAPILKEYDKAIAFARDDDSAPLAAKASFLLTIYDYKDALAVLDALVEKSPVSYSYRLRASALLALGRREDAIEDLREAYDLDASNNTAFDLARQMAYAGQTAEALDLLDRLPIPDEDRIGYADVRATVSGLGGDTKGGLSLLEGEVADKPENSSSLNSDCWFRGLFDVGLDDAIAGCTRAIERSENPVAALDSRALVEFRLGKYDDAMADLDAVLRLAPAIANSRYIRGVVRLRKGDAGGKEDIEKALRINPQLREFYARHGVEPAT